MKKTPFNWTLFLMFIVIVSITEFCFGIIATELINFQNSWILGIFIVNIIIAIRFAQSDIGEIRK